MQLFFVYDDYIVTLPVNPEELTLGFSTDNKEENVVGIGSINMIRDKRLLEVEISSFLAHYEYPFVLTKNQFLEPQYYIDFFSNIADKREPLRFIVTETDVNVMMAIESFNYTYVHGTKDVNFSLKLKEHKPYGVREMRVVQQTAAGEDVYESDQVGRDPEGFAIGDWVFVTGAVLDNPYGDDSEGKILRLAAGEEANINFIWEGESPYRLITDTWRGWVREHQIWHLK